MTISNLFFYKGYDLIVIKFINNDHSFTQKDIIFYSFIL